MTENATERVRASLDAVYQTQSRRILATLIRLLGDFDLAEDALNEAFAVALEDWPKEGLPAKPAPGLVSNGRFKAIDALRRRAVRRLAGGYHRTSRPPSSATSQAVTMTRSKTTGYG